MELINRKLMVTSLQHLQTGFQADCRKQFKEAVLAYMDGAPLLLQLAREEGLGSQVRQFLKSRCQLYLNRIQIIKAGLDSGEDIPLNTVVDKTQPNFDSLDDDSREAIQTWTSLPFSWTLSEIQIAASVKDFLWTNIVLPLLFPGFLGTVTRVKKGMLLYGLPGTGKTMLLCAMASAVACPVLRVTASDLRSRWCGADCMLRRVKAVFVWARQNCPCILCLDDLDVLWEPDAGTEAIFVTTVRNELISGLKSIATESQVTVVAATQRPWFLSGALRRRFDRRFHLALPTTADRTEIFKQRLDGIKHELSEGDLVRIGEMTVGYTGADVAVLVSSCAIEPLRSLQKATHFCKRTVTLMENGNEVVQEMMTPCEPQSPGAVEITFDFLNPECIQVPLVTMAIVENEIHKMRPSCSDLMLQKMTQWMEEFGQED